MFEGFICGVVCIEKDSFRSWVVCFVCFMNFLVIGGITGPLFGIMVPYLDEYFHEEDNMSALFSIGSVQSGTMLLLAPVGGMLISTFQRDYKVCIDFKICALGYLIAATSIVVSTLSPNVMTMVIIYGFCAGAGLSILIMMFIISCDLSFDKQRNLASSIARSGQILGMVIFPSVYNVILIDYGWKYSLYVTFAILMSLMAFGVTLIILQRVFQQTFCNCTLHGDEMKKEESQHLLSDSQELSMPPERTSESHSDHDREMNIDIHERKDKNQDKIEEKEVIVETNEICCPELINPPKNDSKIFDRIRDMISNHSSFLISNNGAAIYILIAKFLGNGSIAVHNNLLPTFLQERGISATMSSSIVSIENSAGFVSALTLGYLAFRNSNSTKITPLNISSVSLFSASIVYFFMIFAYDATTLEILCVLSGITKTQFLTMGSLLWFGTVPLDYYTLAVAYSQVVQGIGVIIFPPIAGMFADMYGNYTSSMVIESIASMSCGVLFGLGSYVSQRFRNT